MSSIENLFGSGEVARRVSLPRWRLIYLIDKGELPGQSLKVPGRRLFTEDDIRRIVAVLARQRDEQSKNEHS